MPSEMNIGSRQALDPSGQIDREICRALGLPCLNIVELSSEGPVALITVGDWTTMVSHIQLPGPGIQVVRLSNQVLRRVPASRDVFMAISEMNNRCTYWRAVAFYEQEDPPTLSVFLAADVIADSFKAIDLHHLLMYRNWYAEQLGSLGIGGQVETATPSESMTNRPPREAMAYMDKAAALEHVHQVTSGMELGALQPGRRTELLFEGVRVQVALEPDDDPHPPYVALRALLGEIPRSADWAWGLAYANFMPGGGRFVVKTGAFLELEVDVLGESFSPSDFYEFGQFAKWAASNYLDVFA